MMRTKYIFIAAALLSATSVVAQETYENANLITEDLNGTARYVGMGGAMEALGADISTISSNPAGIGLFRHSTANISGGLITQSGAPSFAKGDKTNASLDQIGFVYSMKTNRRDFLKTMGGVALFSIVPRQVLGKGFIAPSDQLTKGIIGTGGMGRGHLNYGGTRLVAVCDVDKNHLELGKNLVKEKIAAYHDFRDLILDPNVDIVKIAVVERHKNTGNVAVGLLRGYGIKRGAVALSIAHDSHNIIAVGVSNEEIAFAVEQLIAQTGGVVIAREGQVLESMPLPVGGIMSDQTGEWVDKKLTSLHETAYQKLSINRDVEPVMTLCFMALPVIPELKLTDMGLFDVTKFEFIPMEADE